MVTVSRVGFGVVLKGKGVGLHDTGVIKLPIWKGIKQCKCMVCLKDSPYNSALFGLVI